MAVSEAKPFRRVNGATAGAYAMMTGRAGSRFESLDSWYSSLAVGAGDPLSVPLSRLRRLDADPVIYLAEWCTTALARRPDLYYVSAPGDATGERVAEVEEWLWPLLKRGNGDPQQPGGGGLLDSIVRAFCYGASPYILDWGVEDLVVTRKSGRRRTLRGHVHYTASHEIYPEQVRLEVDGGDLKAIHYGGLSYGPSRARLAIWDRQGGTWRGQSARRRAYKYCYTGDIIENLGDQYLERSVDVPRLVFVNGDGDVLDEEGNTQSVGDHIGAVMASLRNAGVGTLPGNRDASGNRMYSVELLNLPDRSDVWHKATAAKDAKKVFSYLLPPSMAGLDDTLGSGGRIVDKLFSNIVEQLAAFVAAELTAIVEVVHTRNHPASVPPPEILAAPIPDKTSKLFLEVLRSVGEQARLGERVDVPALLDQLGVPTMPGAPAEPLAGPPPPTPKKPGPARDTTSRREERREDAQTPEGEEDTGAPRDTVEG